MQSMWVSLKENVNCVSKRSNVIHRPVGNDNGKKKSCSCKPEKEKMESSHEVVRQMGKPVFCKVLFRPNYPRTQFYELGVEDPARNIVQMIFQRSSIDPSKPPGKIEHVLRVKNSIDVVERFEKHREKVVKKANEEPKRHPRSAVDGNEMLLFYGTTIACCHQRVPKMKVWDPCRNPDCRLCRTIQSKFDMESARKNGIILNRSSQEMSEYNVGGLKKAKKKKMMRRAVVVCRTIAGRVLSDTVDRKYGISDWDSLGFQGLDSNKKCLIVRNPCAVLPCFIVVFT